MPTVHEMSGGGGWRGGNGGPWGQGPRNTGGGGGSGGGGQPPDLEELLRRSQDRLRRVLPRRGGGGGGISPIAIVAVVIVVLGFLAYNFFTFRVEPDQVGVVLRFGEPNRTVEPGLNFRLPAPIETVFTPQVTRENQITIGDISAESLMITSDENILDVTFTVVWLINNAQNYLFNLEEPDQTVRVVAEAAMRQVFGQGEIEELQTVARLETARQVEQIIQDTLDSYGAGIDIIEVNLSAVDPPSQVVAAFEDVISAQLDNQRLQNEALAYSNRVEPEARGRAAQITEAAEAYRLQVIAEATGEADRFLQVYAAYAVAPEVTRERIYLDTMADIFENMNKIIVGDGAGGIVPYLPLNELTPRGAGQ